MEDSGQLSEADRQLNRTLGFFPRVDSKASALFAMNTGVLAVGALNFQASDVGVWYITLPAVVGLLLTASSIFFVYRCMFPHLDGGQGSLIYFREIAARTEANFISQFKDRAGEDHIDDLLGQVWRNSEILKKKFDAVKWAFLLLVFSLMPWAIFLVTSSVTRAQVPLIH